MTTQDAVKPHYSIEFEEARRCAVHELHGVALEQSRERLWTALGDSSWRVRKEAVEVLLAARPNTEQIDSLIRLLRDEDNAGLRNATAEVIVRLGKKAVPALLPYLQDPDHDLRKQVVDALAIIGGKEVISGLVAALDDQDINVAAAAAEALGSVGATQAAPALVRALEQHHHDFFRYNVLSSLGKIGAPAPLSPIIRELVHNDLLRGGVYECLGRIGCDIPAADLLLEGLLSALPSQRRIAVRSLAMVLERLEPLFVQTVMDKLRQAAVQGGVENLLALYDADQPELCHAVVQIAGMLQDQRAIPLLVRALLDEQLASAACAALQELGSAAEVELAHRFGSFDERERAAVCAFFGQRAAVVSPELEQLLLAACDDRSDLVRANAVRAVGRLSAAALVPRTIELLDDPVASVREAALQAVRNCSSVDSAVIREVAAQMLASLEPQRRRVAALLFAVSGDQERLTALMKDVDPLVREAAVRAVGRMRLTDSCSSLVIALVDEVDEVRLAAAEALGACCSCAAIPPLRLALKDRDPWVQAAALRSLIELAGEDALPDILQLWCEGEVVAQLACLEGFDLIADPRGFEAIAHGLGSRDPEVLKGAIEILANRRPDLLQSWHQHIFTHPEWDVRMAAVRATCALPEAEREVLLSATLEHEQHDLVRLEIRRLLDRG